MLGGCAMSDVEAFQLEAATVVSGKTDDSQPKAEAWEELASAEGDYSVADAAKILSRAGIDIGRTRLFRTLHQLRWIFRQSGRWQARQTAVDAGYLCHRAQSHRHPDTGELVLDAPQVRVTPEGVRRIRERLRAAEIPLASTE